MGKKFEDYHKRAEAASNRKKGGSENFTLVPGENILRPLKTPEGKTSPDVMYEFAMHENVGPDKRWVRCGKDPISGKGKCWICDILIPRLERRGKERRAMALMPNVRIVVQVASISDRGKWTGPFLWYPSNKVATELTSTILASRKRDYLDHNRGYNLSIRRTGTKFKNTRYGSLIPDMESSRVPSKILDKLKPFDRLKTSSGYPRIPEYDRKRQQDTYFGRNSD